MPGQYLQAERLCFNLPNGRTDAGGLESTLETADA